MFRRRSEYQAIAAQQAAAVAITRLPDDEGGGVANPLLFYPSFSKDDFVTELNALAAEAGVDDDYPTLGEDCLPAEPSIPDPEDLSVVHVDNWADLASNYAAGGKYIILDDDIVASGQLTNDGAAAGVAGGNIVDLNGHNIDVIAITSFGGYSHNCMFMNGTCGFITSPSGNPAIHWNDMCFRFLHIDPVAFSGPDANGAVQFTSTGGGEKLMIIGCNITGAHQGNIAYGDVDDVWIVNTNVEIDYANYFGGGAWAIRYSNSDRLVVLDCWLLAGSQRVIRIGDDVDGTDEGFVLWSSPDHRADTRRSQLIHYEHAYWFEAMNNCDKDKVVCAHFDAHGGDAAGTNLSWGSETCAGSGAETLYLLLVGYARTFTEGGFIDASRITGLTAPTPPEGPWDHNVGNHNTYGSTSTNPLTPPTKPAIVDFELGTMSF